MKTPEADYRGGEGSPLILLHGATAAWHAWRPVLLALEEHHAVWAPTMAGHHGGPDLDVEPHLVVSAIVDDMCRRMDDAGLARAHLAGNSLGGWVALELARRDRALSVVALSPAGAWELPKDLQSLLRLFRLGKAMGHRKTVQRLASLRWVRRVLLGNVCARADRIPRRAVQEMFDDMAGCTVLDDLLDGASQAGPIRPFGEVGCPVRIAWAGKDRTLPYARYGRPMLAAVPQAERVRMPGVGHVPMWDDPALVTRTILDVTRAVDRPPTDGPTRKPRTSRRQDPA